MSGGSGGAGGAETDNRAALALHLAGGGFLAQKLEVALALARALFSSSGQAAASGGASGHGGGILVIACGASGAAGGGAGVFVGTAETANSGVCGDPEAVKRAVGKQLQACPRSVVILHGVESLPQPGLASLGGLGGLGGVAPGRDGGSGHGVTHGGRSFGSAGGLVALERFFEDANVDVAEVGTVDTRRAVFILTSEVGKGALESTGVAAADFYPRDDEQEGGGGGGDDDDDSVSSRPELAGVRRARSTEWVLAVVRSATREWTAQRPALGGRLSTSQVPFV